MSQTPRSVFQDGSAEVPTSAWGITPPRIKAAKKHATAVERGQAENQPQSSRTVTATRGLVAPQRGRVGNSSILAMANEQGGATSRHLCQDLRHSENRSPRGPPSRKCTRRATLGLNPRWVQRAVSAVSLRTASRPVELSLQSTLQLSLTVLVRYRTRARI